MHHGALSTATAKGLIELRRRIARADIPASKPRSAQAGCRGLALLCLDVVLPVARWLSTRTRVQRRGRLVVRRRAPQRLARFIEALIGHEARLGPAMQASALIGLVGIEAQLVRVEVDSGRAPACFQLVGLAEAAVREARVRVRSALRGLGVDIDEYVLTVSLSPADVRKLVAAFDLAMAIGVLVALGRVPAESSDGVAFLGELVLCGDVRPVRGVLAALLEAQRSLGIRRAVVPLANAAEAAAVVGIAVDVAPTLASVVDALKGEGALDGEARDRDWRRGRASVLSTKGCSAAAAPHGSSRWRAPRTPALSIRGATPHSCACAISER